MPVRNRSIKGEYVGLEFNTDAVCILEPCSRPLTLKSFLGFQSADDQYSKEQSDFLNCDYENGTSIYYLNVHVLSNNSSLDIKAKVAALRVLNGTFIYIGQEHNCYPVSFDNEQNSPIKVLSSEDTMAFSEPEIIPLPTLLPPPTFINVTTTFPNCDFCQQYHLCPQQVFTVKFTHNESRLCIYDPESDDIRFLQFFLGTSSRLQHPFNKIVNIRNAVHLLTVRMMKNVTTWELDSAYFLRILNNTALFIANTSCVNPVDHPIQFILSDDGT